MTPRTLIFLGLFGAFMLMAIVSRVTKLSFCGNTYSIPNGCEAKSKHKVDCGEYKMSWSYVDCKMLNYMAEDAAQELELSSYKSTRENISCFLKDTEVNAFKITTFVNGEIEACQIIAYGIVNEYPVLVQLYVAGEIKTNESIPETMRQIIRLTK